MTARLSQPPGTIGACATLACLWEATAAKPGNVYRGADFADMSYADFLASAAAIGPVFDHAGELPIGRLVLDAARATRRAVATNTNLGTLLLLAPLANAAAAGTVREAIDAELAGATVEDARLAYEAIRTAAPGGLGRAAQSDVADQPDVTLLEAMRLAADRDLIARQYTTAFADVFATAGAITAHAAAGKPLADAIVWAHVELMAREPDTLIARKCGVDAARESAARAGRVLDLVRDDGEDFALAAAELDFWLRGDGNRRNPGATADVIAAALFVLLVGDELAWPVRFYGGG
ncbi:MAG: triphosphoribosyl-dephospho-CoA synthase [Planctomycetota bacterium]